MTKRTMTTELFSRTQTILKAKNKSTDTFRYGLSTKFIEQKWGK